MGNKAKRPGQTSELVAATTSSAPAMLAALVMQLGGRVLISFEALAQVADQVNMTVSTMPEGTLLQTVLKPIIAGQVNVPEGPVSALDLAGLGSDMPPDSQGAQEDGYNQPDPELEERVAEALPFVEGPEADMTAREYFGQPEPDPEG